MIEACINAGYRVILLAPSGPETSALEALGTTFIPLQHLSRRGRNPLRELALLRELTRIYQRKSIDCALHFTIKPVIYGSLAARWAGVANISTLTGLGYTFLAGRKTNLTVRWLYRLALQNADRILFHNPDDQQLFVSSNLCRMDQTEVVGGSGIKLVDFPFTPIDAAQQGRFLFAGRLLTDKGIKEYIAAAIAAKATHPSLRFHVVGGVDSGNPAAISSEELDRWIESGDIIYDGVTTDIKPHLQQAFCVVLPSYREGCPRVLLEAAATGRPLIGTDVPGVREVVLDGENGALVPVKSAEKLQQAMLTMYHSSAKDQADMGRRSRELVERGFSERTVVAVYLSALAEVCRNT